MTTLLASDLIGRRVRDRQGRDLGIVVDLHATRTRDGTLAVTEVVAGHRRRLRLLGYERPEIRGPWIIAVLARALQGPVHTIPYDHVELDQIVPDHPSGERSR